MKKLSLYQGNGVVLFDFDKIESLKHTVLTELQSEKIGFIPLFDEELYSTQVKDYTVFKVRHTKRVEPKAETIEREFTSRTKKLARQELSFDMDEVLEEVNIDLMRTAEQKGNDFLAVYDHVQGMFMIDAPRNAAEDVMSLLHELYEDTTFEVVMTEPKYMQDLLTGYVVKQSTIPEPFALGEYVELAKPVKVGDKAGKSLVTVKEHPASCQEVINHLTQNKRINKIELDCDGILFPVIDTTFFISKLVLEGDMKLVVDKGLSEEENMIAHWSVLFPEVSKMINILLLDLTNKGEV